MISRPPRSTRTDPLFPTRRSSDLRTKEKLPTAVYVYPEEGITFWSDNFVVPSSAPNKENAKTFINWMMAPENIAIASNFTGYMNAIRGSDAFMDEALKNDPAVVMPEEYANRLRPNEDCSAAARELRNKVWTRLKSRSEEHTSELQSLMRNSYAVFCL